MAGTWCGPCRPHERMHAAAPLAAVGGGVQGLLALDALVKMGYSCALVCDGALGSGQALHSHGFLNSGFGFGGPELQQASTGVVQPDLVARGVNLDQDWVFIPPPGFPVPEGLPHATLPPEFDGVPGEPAAKCADSPFPQRRLVEVLSEGHQHRVIRGSATPVLTGGGADTVTIRCTATCE